MSEIIVERSPGEQRHLAIGVSEWGYLEERSFKIPIYLSTNASCVTRSLERNVIVTPDGGMLARITKGGLVTFPAGMGCTWDTRVAMRKHYQFG